MLDAILNYELKVFDTNYCQSFVLSFVMYICAVSHYVEELLLSEIDLCPNINNTDRIFISMNIAWLLTLIRMWSCGLINFTQVLLQISLSVHL